MEYIQTHVRVQIKLRKCEDGVDCINVLDVISYYILKCYQWENRKCEYMESFCIISCNSIQKVELENYGFYLLSVALSDHRL